MEKIKPGDIKKGDKIRVEIGEVDWFYYSAIEYVANSDESYIMHHTDEVEFYLLDRPKKPFVLKEGMVMQHPESSMFVGVYITDDEGNKSWLAYDNEEPEMHWHLKEWGEAKYEAGWVVTYEGRDA